MKVKIINQSNNEAPSYATIESAGMDLRAFCDNEILLKPLERKLIKTGVFLEIPKGYEGQVRPRSGLALKHGITVLNSPGTIDSDYRGEIGVILINLSNKEFIVKNGDRIAQLVFCSHETIVFDESNSINDSQRGSGGFGSTGKK
tara:strand:+ start:1022 stop:1456 length:435 start_codon:yes stop_codon:yes gene_type:complete